MKHMVTVREKFGEAHQEVTKAVYDRMADVKTRFTRATKTMGYIYGLYEHQSHSLDKHTTLLLDEPVHYAKPMTFIIDGMKTVEKEIAELEDTLAEADKLLDTEYSETTWREIIFGSKLAGETLDKYSSELGKIRKMRLAAMRKKPGQAKQIISYIGSHLDDTEKRICEIYARHSYVEVFSAGTKAFSNLEDAVGYLIKALAEAEGAHSRHWGATETALKEENLPCPIHAGKLGH